MQIIEVTDLAVRSAIIRLRRRETPMQFMLYPMFHVAEPSFYSAAATRLKNADVVVVEGVGGDNQKRSTLLGALTLSYTVLRFSRRVGLVKQNINYSTLDAVIVNPDVSLKEFEADWRRVPLTIRLQIWCLLPFIIVARLFGGTKMIWSRSLELNDLPSPEEEELADHSAELDAAFGGRRDERVLAALYQLHEQHNHEDTEVAVVYGAAHIPAIVRGLMGRYAYRPRSADWLTVTNL